MLVHALTVVFLLLSGVLAGVLVAVEIAVVPMLGALPGDRFVQVHRLLDPRFDPLLPRASKIALVAGVALLVVGSDGIVNRVAFALAELCIVGVALVSELRNVPINRRIDTWDGTDLPAGWQELQTRWFRANRLRTVLAVAGFAAAATATFAV